MSIVIHPERSSVAVVSKKDEEVVEHSSLWIEARRLFDLAIPTIIIHLSFVVPPFLTASYVGRQFGHIYLDGYTLANLTGNLMTLALLQGLYSACDTLSPQAFGAGNYREVGLLAIRGYVATLVIIIAVNIPLFLFMYRILQFLGQDSEASEHAWHFYLLYALSFPFNSLYCIIWKFLSSQHILLPLVVCTLFCTVVFLPLCLEFFVRWLGFLGAAAAITLFFVFQALSVLVWVCWFQPHHPETWPGLSAWKEALCWKPFKDYVLLGIGGMLASLEWVYWEALALVIGTLGVLPLSAHAIPTQVIFVTFMFPLGLGIALAIRLGVTLSSQVERAKRLAWGTVLFSFVVFGLSSILMYIYREPMFRMFTNESQVLELCEGIWFDVCLYFLILSVFGINVGISLGLGMQWTLGMVTAVCLWLVGMPASYYFAVVRGGGLQAAWRCIWPPYVMVNIVMIATFVCKDWDELSLTIRIREGLKNGDKSDGGLESLALIEGDDENGDSSDAKYGSIVNKTRQT